MKNIGIVGLGLMGGSFAKALKKSGKYVVFGFDKCEETLKTAKSDKAIDFVLDEENIKIVDLLVAAVTPDKLENALSLFLPRLKDGAFVTDFCGVKKAPVSTMQKWEKEFPSLKFFGGHPMAGKEKYGYENSDGDLFCGAYMIMVPITDEIPEKVKQVFYDTGFKKITVTDAETHDRTIAYTSELCHIVSSAFIKNKTALKHEGFSAGSLKDLTRVARLSPEMWTGLIMANRRNVLSELDEFTENLEKYRTALECCDEKELLRLFEEGNALKEKYDGEK